MLIILLLKNRFIKPKSFVYKKRYLWLLGDLQKNKKLYSYAKIEKKNTHSQSHMMAFFS